MMFNLNLIEMVTVIEVKERVNRNGEPFHALIVSGGIDIVQSKSTGKSYLTERQARLPTTLDRKKCQSLIGKELPGTISKVPCMPFDYTVPESGEIIRINHRWEYVSDESFPGNTNAFGPKEEEESLVLELEEMLI